MDNILTAKNVTKTYLLGKQNSNKVLNNVNLTISPGEFVSVMGASGSGKSTLLYNVSGMDRMTSGNVTFLGQQIESLTEPELTSLRLSEMGFIFQQNSLLKNLNIFDNIVAPAYLANTENRNTINQRAEQLMAQTGIADVAENDITQASGGQLQRAAICRALINQPQILFGDEPTGALNSKATGEVMDILSEINATGTTIMLVTHDAKVAARGGRVLFMSDGEITGEKKFDNSSQDPTDIKQREFELVAWLEQMGF